MVFKVRFLLTLVLVLSMFYSVFELEVNRDEVFNDCRLKQLYVNTLVIHPEAFSLQFLSFGTAGFVVDLKLDYPPLVFPSKLVVKI